MTLIEVEAEVEAAWAEPVTPAQQAWRRLAVEARAAARTQPELDPRIVADSRRRWVLQRLLSGPPSLIGVIEALLLFGDEP